MHCILYTIILCTAFYLSGYTYFETLCRPCDRLTVQQTDRLMDIVTYRADIAADNEELRYFSNSV